MTSSDTPASDPGLEPEFHTPPVADHGRAGRNLPAAIGVGVVLGAWLVIGLWKFPPAFAALVALALAQGAIEVSNALRRLDMHAAIVPIVVGTVGIVIGSYFAGIQDPVEVPSNTFLLAALGVTTLAAMIWRMPKGQDGYVRDTAASLFVIAYIPLLGAFVALLLAGDDGSARVVTFISIVVASDIGGYLVGVLIGRHPMAPRISPKKSWEGFAGSMAFGIGIGTWLAHWLLGAQWWVGALLGVCLVAVGVCGDLIESLIKRDVGIKDMSSILPGHGGVMDRLDSLLVAAPVAWLVMYLLVPGG